jgi:NADPH2:quinone reductase
MPKKMKAVLMTVPGGPEVLKIGETDVPQPRDHELLIRVAAIGMNQADIIMRSPDTPLPIKQRNRTPGMELSGEVVQVGASVSDFSIGDRICGLSDGGGCAEYCIVPSTACWPVPDDYSDHEAAALPDAVMTVWTSLYDPAVIRPGETLLIHGATSGIGIVAVMLAQALGAKVFATAGSKTKCEVLAELGVDCAINYKAEDFVDVVNKQTDGRGVDVIFDLVGGPYLDRNVAALSSWGRLVVYGMMGGAEGSLNVATLMAKNISIRGSSIFFTDRELKARKLRAGYERVWPLLGELPKPIIDSVFPLEKTSDAHRYMEQGGHIGKIIIATDGS